MKRQVFTTHLRDWNPAKSIHSAEELKGLMEHAGWPILLEALELREKDVRNDLLAREPTDSAAHYATTVGELRGLRQIESIAEGIVENGRKGEDRLRRDEEPAAVQAT